MKNSKFSGVIRFLSLMIVLLYAFTGITAQETLPIPESPDAVQPNVYNGFWFNIPSQIVDDGKKVSAFDIRRQLSTEGYYLVKFKNNVTKVTSTFHLPRNLFSLYNDGSIGFNLVEADILPSLENNASYAVRLIFKDTTNAQTYKSEKKQVTVAKALPVELVSPANNTIYDGFVFTWKTDPFKTAKSYRLTIYDAKTGRPIFTKLKDPATCAENCFLAVYADTLIPGTGYKWEVKTIGFEGSVSQSAQWGFVANWLP